MWEAEAGEPRVQGQSEQHGESLSQKNSQWGFVAQQKVFTAGD